MPRRRERDADAPADVIPAFAGHAIRRRGWVLRRALLLADVAAFLRARSRRSRSSSAGSIDFSDPAVWALGAGGARRSGCCSRTATACTRTTRSRPSGRRPTTCRASSCSSRCSPGSASCSRNGTGHRAARSSAWRRCFWAGAVALLLIGRGDRPLGRPPPVRARASARSIVGAGRVGAEIARKLGRRPEYGLDVIGFLDDDPLIAPEDGPPHLGGTSPDRARCCARTASSA